MLRSPDTTTRLLHLFVKNQELFPFTHMRDGYIPE